MEVNEISAFVSAVLKGINEKYKGKGAVEFELNINGNIVRFKVALDD